MKYLFFAGEYEELKVIEEELRNQGQKVVPISTVNFNRSWTETILPIVFALLTSTVVATAIQEYVRKNITPITIEYEKDGEKLKITCPKNCMGEMKKMLIELKIIES